jgi:hypothetical protein
MQPERLPITAEYIADLELYYKHYGVYVNRKTRLASLVRLSKLHKEVKSTLPNKA